MLYSLELMPCIMIVSIFKKYLSSMPQKFLNPIQFIIENGEHANEYYYQPNYKWFQTILFNFETRNWKFLAELPLESCKICRKYLPISSVIFINKQGIK